MPSPPVRRTALVATLALATLVPPAPTVASDAPHQIPAAQLYCRNIAEAAADARYARQVNALTGLEERLAQRIAELDEKRAELEAWVTRREEMMQQADDAIVAIYSQMRPDAAALQISVMDAEAAAAILSKVAPRTASAILNEMEAETAAYLANTMAARSLQSDAG